MKQPGFWFEYQELTVEWEKKSVAARRNRGLNRCPIVKLIKVILTKLNQKHHTIRYVIYNKANLMVN